MLRDPAVSAFGLPNGTIYVTTGLLAALENDDQLAGVLAHEISHVMNHDGYEAMRQYRQKTLDPHNVLRLAAAGGGVAVSAAGVPGIRGLASRYQRLRARPSESPKSLWSPQRSPATTRTLSAKPIKARLRRSGEPIATLRRSLQRSIGCARSSPPKPSRRFIQAATRLTSDWPISTKLSVKAWRRRGARPRT